MYLDYDVPFATVKEREVKDVNYKDDRARLDELNRKIKQLEPVNMMAIDEYKKEGERYEFLSSQRDDITASIDDLKKVLKDVDNRIRDKFSEGFKVVQENFKKLFYEMFWSCLLASFHSSSHRPIRSRMLAARWAAASDGSTSPASPK